MKLPLLGECRGPTSARATSEISDNSNGNGVHLSNGVPGSMNPNRPLQIENQHLNSMAEAHSQ
jgi:hypothetical protein